MIAPRISDLQKLDKLGVDVYFEKENLWLHQKEVLKKYRLRAEISSVKEYEKILNKRWNFTQFYAIIKAENGVLKQRYKLWFAKGRHQELIWWVQHLPY